MSIKDYDGKPTFLQRIGLGLPIDSKGNPPNRTRTAEEWDEWKNEMKKEHPIKYFFNEDFESTFIWPITMPIKRVKEWVEYRTTRRYHIVNTGAEPGYMDTGERMFHASFNLLKDFVEVEKASMQAWSGDTKLKGADAGIAYLKWEMNLSDGGENQAENASEVYELYNWWMHTRPNRVDPLDTDLAKKYYKLSKEIYGTEFSLSHAKDTEELTELRDKYHKESGELEMAYDKEDLEMFTRLAKINNGLWT